MVIKLYLYYVLSKVIVIEGIEDFITIMVNRCSVFGCFTNHKGHQKGIVFGSKSVKEPDRRQQWIRFCNRQDLRPDSAVFICEKHFEEKYIKRNKEQPRLITNLSPIPTINPAGVYDKKTSCLPPITTTRRPPTQRIYQQDELSNYKSQFKIDSFEDVNESLLKLIDSEYKCSSYDDHVVFFKIVLDELSIPKITECIRIDSDLHVKLFFKGSPIPLPEWLRKGSVCKLTSKDMLPNLCNYIRQESNQCEDVLEEMHRLRFKKRPIYSARVIRYALALRYSSLPAYKLLLEQFKLPSVSLLRRITSGKIDTLKTLKLLRENGSISDDVILMFDEMFLQQCEEYTGGKIITYFLPKI